MTPRPAVTAAATRQTEWGLRVATSLQQTGQWSSSVWDALAEAWAANHGGANIWANKTVKFLDPCTKSGVFLREITSRLTKGLEQEIPMLEKRVNHILTKQVFGICITKITSLLARRSVYCSKHATGRHSVAP